MSKERSRSFGEQGAPSPRPVRQQVGLFLMFLANTQPARPQHKSHHQRFTVTVSGVPLISRPLLHKPTLYKDHHDH